MKRSKLHKNSKLYKQQVVIRSLKYELEKLQTRMEYNEFLAVQQNQDLKIAKESLDHWKNLYIEKCQEYNGWCLTIGKKLEKI